MFHNDNMSSYFNNDSLKYKLFGLLKKIVRRTFDIFINTLLKIHLKYLIDKFYV